MSTGTGTGTPVTGISSATLATLRARVLKQVQRAGGFTEPQVVTPSTIALTTAGTGLRDRVEATLQDAGNLKWATADIDEGIRKALEQYSQVDPARAITSLTLSSSGREIDLSSITGLVRVESVWWDYDSSSPGHPPNWRQFEVWPGKLLYIDDPDEPQAGEIVRVWYTKMHTINGLDSATATTVPAEDIPHIIAGAAHFCAQMRVVEVSEALNIDGGVTTRLKDAAEEFGKAFRYGIGRKLPAWQRYAYGYDQNDIDEAIRWALHRYSQIDPARAITTLTLTAAGREISTATITEAIQIERVWWDYDSSDPTHPPAYRDFEIWPGNLLYINDDEEPASGDVVRVWYTRLHTLNGLDSATTTTIPFDAETLIVVGASGFAAQERVQETEGNFVPVRLREWADARLREFDRGLKAVGRRVAARAAGIALAPALDRWDDGW